MESSLTHSITSSSWPPKIHRILATGRNTGHNINFHRQHYLRRWENISPRERPSESITNCPSPPAPNFKKHIGTLPQRKAGAGMA